MIRSVQLRTHSIYQPGSEPVCTIADRVRLTYRRSIRLQDSEVALVVHPDSEAASVINQNQVLRIVTHTGHEEWMVDDFDESTDGDLVAICRSLIYKLAEPPAVRTIVSATGLPNFRFALTNVLPLTILETYVRQPLLDEGQQWFTIEAVDFTTPLEAFDWERQKPLGILETLAEHPQIAGEYTLRDTGFSWGLELVKLVNGNLPPVAVRFRKNLEHVRRQTKGVDLYTVIEPSGDQAPDGTPGTMAYNNWLITAKPGGGRLRLADPLGRDPPIQYDGQLPAGAHAFRYLKGSSQAIVNAFAPDEIEVGNDAHYAIGDHVEIRAGAPALDTIDYQQTFGDTRFPTRVTALNAGLRQVTIDQPFPSGTDAITKDDGYLGWNARILSRILTTTTVTFTQATMKLRVVDAVTSVQIGDRVMLTTNAVTGAPPWLAHSTHFTAKVTAIDSANKDLTLELLPQYGGWAADLTGTIQCSIWRQDAVTEIDTCAAAGNTAVLQSVTGAAVDDLVEIFRYVDGNMLTELSAPSQVVVYGRRVGPLDVGGLAHNQVAPNGFFNNWPGGANALPEGYDAAWSTCPLGALRTTGVGNVIHGSFSAKIRRGALILTVITNGGQPLLNIGLGTVANVVPGSVIRLNAGQPNEETVTVQSVVSPTQLQLTADLLFAHGNNENGIELGANGSQASPSGISTLSTPVHVMPVPAPNTTVHFQAHVFAFGFTVGQRAELRVIGLNGAVLGLAQTSLRDQFVTIGCSVQMNPGQQFRVELRTNPTADNTQVEAYIIVDAVNWHIATYQPERFTEFSLGTLLWQAANDRLPATAFLPGVWQVQVADLSLLFADEAFVEGGSVAVTEPRLGALNLVRRIRVVDGDYDSAVPTALELETDEQAMTRLMSSARVATPRVVVELTPGSAGPVPGVTATVTSILEQQPLRFGGNPAIPSRAPVAPFIEDALAPGPLIPSTIRTFNIQDDYGAGRAVPDSDGAGSGTDNTPMIQAALNAMPVTPLTDPPVGGILYCPPGRYRVTNSLFVRPGTWILCAGAGSVAFDFEHPTADLFVADQSSHVFDPDWLRIENLKVQRVGTGATGYALNLGAFGSAGPIRTMSLINVNFAGFIKAIRLVSSVKGFGLNVRLDGPFNEGGRDVAGSVGAEFVSCNSFLCLGWYVNNFENGIIGATSGALKFENCTLEHNGNGYWHQGGSAVWEMPDINSTPVSANLVDFQLDAGGCLLIGYGSQAHSIRYGPNNDNTTVKSRSNRLMASNDRGPADHVFPGTISGPVGNQLGDLLIQNDRRMFFAGISFDTPTLVPEKTAGYSAQWDERFFPMNASAGAITLTLPEITSDDTEDGALFIRVGQEVTVQKVDASANDVNYAPRGTDTIDGSASTRRMRGQWDCVRLRAVDVGKWRTISYRMARTPLTSSVISQSSNYANNPGNGDCMTADLNSLRAAYESLRLYVETLRGRMDDA